MNPLKMIGDFFASVTRNYISIAGTVLATTMAVLILTFLFLEFLGFHGGPYLGILTFLIFPMLFILGLLLIPVGIMLAKWRARKAGNSGVTVERKLPVIDFNNERTRNVVLVVVMLSLVNVIILAGAIYKGVHVMESTAFCGTACHTVMQPESTAHQRSPHARVDCVDCHIGPGADWFVKSKISGAWQLIAVTFDLYPRPIQTPVHDLRPARDTCEQCHWPEKFVGNKLQVSTHYAEDEANTESKTVKLLKVGGLQGSESRGIHWHVSRDNEIRYLADESRETIFDVELSLPDGTKKLFKNGDAPEAAVWRTMDCVDCHNRPTHVYRQPGDEIDLAMLEGRIDANLPFIRREALKALRLEHGSHDDARIGIAAAIDTFYRTEYPDVREGQAAAIEAAASHLGDIFAYNVFPAMNVTWDTYPNHIGHQNSPGCFRCHDGRHRAEDRQRISKDCEACHTILAEREEDPEILQQLLP